MDNASVNPDDDTKTRILKSALRLFQQRGYHATGLQDILALAEAPKGSLYHHFPEGKEQIGIAVIGLLQSMVQKLFSRGRARSTEAVVQAAGAEMLAMMERSGFQTCCLFSSFASDSQTTPALTQAVAEAYSGMSASMAIELQADGFTAREARERAIAVVALLEGAVLLAVAQKSGVPLRAAVKACVLLCKPLRETSASDAT
jgi:TetR/AcrR family transcriptional regulator, lmrAB and yxaGH operons repressor